MKSSARAQLVPYGVQRFTAASATPGTWRIRVRIRSTTAGPSASV